MKTWDRSSRWGIVVLKPGALSAHTNSAAYLEAASALESSGSVDAARHAYHAASERWPENPLGWFGLGNTEYALGHYVLAEQAYRQVISINPMTASAWNNLAHSLAAQHCMLLARQAVQCAIRIEPGNRELDNTLKEIGNMRHIETVLCSPLPDCPVKQADSGA
jgi:tetratricopeptide (TPR) repeat protein